MNLKSIKSDNLLGIKHGFFTRLGGVSSNIYSGLNCGLGSNDKQKSVHQNRMLVAKFLDIRRSQLIFVHQIHSAKVITIRDKPTKPLKGDAIVTNSKNLALSILTADCQPVLFADKKNSVIASHLFMEASRLAYLDRAAYIADPAFFKVPTSKLISNSYLEKRSSLINLKKHSNNFKKGTSFKPNSSANSEKVLTDPVFPAVAFPPTL